MPFLAKRIIPGLLAVIGITIAQSWIHQQRGEAGDFAPYIDEGSHFATALMIRDYATQAFPGNPISYAKNYYMHYPKVSFGSWPPLFHVALGIWMLIAPATRLSAIVYVEALTAALVILGYVFARRTLPPALAAAVAAGVWLSQVPQFTARIVQADTQYAVLSALTVYLFAKYLELPSRGGAVWLGLALFGALLTKNNALFLPLSFAIVLLLSREWRPLRRVELWVALAPGAIGMVLWQWLTLPFVRNNMKGIAPESTPGLTLIGYGEQLFRLIWPGWVPVALFGIWLAIGRPLRLGKRVPLVHCASLALLAGPSLFHAMLPHDVNQRYLLPSLPALLIFVAHGLDGALSMRWVSVIPGILRRVAICGGLAATVITVSIAPLPATDYARVARTLTATGRATSVLVIGSFGGEALLIPEIMIRERRPGSWLLRSYKILRRRTGTLNRQTQLVETDPAEMLAYLQSLPVELIVMADDGDDEAAAHVGYMRAMMRAHPALFTPVFSEPIGPICENPAPCSIEVFRLANTREGAFDPTKLPSGMGLWKGL